MARHSASLATRDMPIQTTVRSAPVTQHERQTKRVHALERMGKQDHTAGGIGKGTGTMENIRGFLKSKHRCAISRCTNGEIRTPVTQGPRYFHGSPIYSSLNTRWSQKSFSSMTVQLQNRATYAQQKHVVGLLILGFCIPAPYQTHTEYALGLIMVAYKLNLYRFFSSSFFPQQ